jgi:FtsP/CotA-like multicopper oxidase with cupredoxin domain
MLTLDLSIRNVQEPDGSSRYCYLLPDGTQSPTLRLYPGDVLILRLKNDLIEPRPALFSPGTAAQPAKHEAICRAPTSLSSDPCKSGAMTPTSTNLHFHGLTVPPLCHQDDVLKTSIQPADPVFEYRFSVPADEPPGLYWYHPHIHGFSSREVLGGASGALIIEGIERANADVAGLPERVFVVRDQNLLNPDASPHSRPFCPK